MLSKSSLLGRAVAATSLLGSLRRVAASRSMTRNWSIAAVLLGTFLILPSLASATALPSKFTENTTLTSAGNPYTSSSTIESGVTLKVEPGVKFTINTLTVKGALKAEGTAENPIVFTSCAKTPAAGDW